MGVGKRGRRHWVRDDEDAEWAEACTLVFGGHARGRLVGGQGRQMSSDGVQAHEDVL